MDAASFSGAAHFRAAAARFSNIVRAFKHHREAAALSDLDDRMLADIGVTRSDLRTAMIEPLWNDPTSVLACRVRQRTDGSSNRLRF